MANREWMSGLGVGTFIPDGYDMYIGLLRGP